MHEPGGTLRSSALDLEVMTSYSGNQEDVRLRRVADLLPAKTYVDVGAGDPVDGSVTYWLYTQGWRGVLVEPGSRSERLAAARPDDVVITAAVGASGGEIVLYETSPDAGMSTVRPDRLAEVLALGQSVVERRIQRVTLSDVFEAAAGPVSILNVDVEGAEGDVLSSLDWSVHRPAVVVVEAIMPWHAVSTRADFEHHLLGAGYVAAAFDGVNTFYVDSSFDRAEELAATLAYPLSALDRWEPAALVAAREDAAVARQELAATVAEAARAEERAAAVAARAAEERRKLVADVAALEERVDVLATTLQSAGQQNAHLQRLNAGLSDQLQAILSSTTWRYGSPVAHAMAKRTRQLRAVRERRPDGAQLRASVRGRIDAARLRHASVEARAELAVRRHTAAAFLKGAQPASLVARPPIGGTWAQVADSIRADTDDELRARLERRDGVRTPLERAILLATLAEATPDKRSPARHAGSARQTCVVDVRSLQEAGLSRRGVGQYAHEICTVLLARDEPIVFFVDPLLPPLSTEWQGVPTTDTVNAELARATRWLVQPSPMTHEQWPLARLLDEPSVWCTAVAYDIIPSQYPSVYLPDPQQQMSQAARLQALRLYDELLYISRTTADDLAPLRRRNQDDPIVWPSRSHDPPGAAAFDSAPALPGDFVLILVGNEHRKNAVAALGAVALLRAAGADVDAVVLGWSGPTPHLMKMAQDVGLPEQAVHVLPYLSAAAVEAVRSAASVAVVPSFAEGLSLPVIECVRGDCPVVASDIAPHRELVGDGIWLADPASPASFAAALDAVRRDRAGVVSAQQARLAAHEHTTVALALTARAGRLKETSVTASRVQGKRPSVGVVTPWPPQRSGVADYSLATIPPLASHADVTVYISSSAAALTLPGVEFAAATAAEPRLGRHDALVTVMGNSHFHLPGLEVVDFRGGAVLCHDVRLTELNSYVRPAGVGTPQHGAAVTQGRTLRHELDALPDLGFGEVAASADLILFHSESAAARVRRETGARTASLPFVPYRTPGEQRSPEARAAAAAALGLEQQTVHLGLIGGVDLRTKAADVIVEAHAWLRQWGHDVVLHVVGGVEPVIKTHLQRIVADAETERHVRWYGHVDDAVYRRFLLALDLGVQLRTASLLSLSGAAADLAAFGIPSVATAAMIDDMGLPTFIRGVSDDFSPLLVAEALESALTAWDSAADLEMQRQDYLARHSVQEYADRLLAALQLDVT
jgi:FkbM family methyltransferase